MSRASYWGTSFLMLLAVLGATTAGLGATYLARDGSALPESIELKAGVVYGATLLAVWLSLRLGRFNGDPYLLPIAGMLGGIGLIMTVRLQPDLAATRGLTIDVGERQLLYLVAGLILIWAIALLAPNPEILAPYRYSVLSAGLALLALTAVAGTEINGARLWISAGPVVIQSTEVVKLALIVFLAAYLSQNLELVGSSWRLGRLRVPPLPYLAPMVVMCGLSTAALMILNDLGTGLLFFMVFMMMLYAANGRASQFFLGVALFMGAFALAYFAVPRVRLRFDVWIDPWGDLVSGYQQIQAEYALATGGFFGVGLGKGSPWLVPVVENDYIIAAIGEETGFFGIVAVIAMYMLLATRGMVIARSAPTSFLRLLAVGLTTGIVVQSVIILAGVLRLMPLTGVTLPLIAYGGSSILVTSVMIGALMKISAFEPGNGAHRRSKAES
ncbi:MAG: FtsW/RodA/SpoVE family cell cycle protein [Thermomicrobiales bacterium]